MPRPLKDAVERFEAELSAISYVRGCSPVYKDGKVIIVMWDDAEGHHTVFQDDEGWYAYERL